MVTMKKRMKDVLFVCITILCLLLTGCKQVENRNLEADDAISEAIYAEFGDKLYYGGCRKDEDYNMWRYSYMIHDYEAEDVIAAVKNIVQRVIEEESLDNNIRIYFTEEFSRTGWETVACIANFKSGDERMTYYGDMEYLYIKGTTDSTHNDTSPYNEPSTYFNIEGIKYLEISEKINQIAEEEGVDWYEVFPELESFSVDE